MKTNPFFERIKHDLPQEPQLTKYRAGVILDNNSLWVNSYIIPIKKTTQNVFI